MLIPGPSEVLQLGLSKTTDDQEENRREQHVPHTHRQSSATSIPKLWWALGCDVCTGAQDGGRVSSFQGWPGVGRETRRGNPWSKVRAWAAPSGAPALHPLCGHETFPRRGILGPAQFARISAERGLRDAPSWEESCYICLFSAASSSKPWLRQMAQFAVTNSGPLKASPIASRASFSFIFYSPLQDSKLHVCKLQVCFLPPVNSRPSSLTYGCCAIRSVEG